MSVTIVTGSDYLPTELPNAYYHCFTYAIWQALWGRSKLSCIVAYTYDLRQVDHAVIGWIY